MNPTDPDRFYSQLIEETRSAEARAWLASGSATLGELDAQESSQFVETAYSLGAEKLIAVEIDEYPDLGFENTGRLCVELPDDPEARKRVFFWAHQLAEEQGFEGEPDVGQRYLFLMLD